MPSKNKEGEIKLQYMGDYLEEYPDYWAILLDKGYQASIEMARSIYPP